VLADSRLRPVYSLLQRDVLIFELYWHARLDRLLWDVREHANCEGLHLDSVFRFELYLEQYLENDRYCFVKRVLIDHQVGARLVHFLLLCSKVLWLAQANRLSRTELSP